jgi:thiol-disulfide isomerase/thioredoxin
MAFALKSGLFFVYAVVTMSVYGQQYDKELKVGERLPVSELRGMINYPQETLKFSDRRPKLTILDFWATTCTACVEAWPKMLEIQKEFGDDIQIILVNRHEDEKRVKNFIERRKKLTGVSMTLPVSCKDSALWAAFPRSGVPRYCWIDHNGVLSSVTYTDQVSKENIKKWITSGPFRMDQVIDEMEWVKGNKPIFVDGNGGLDRGDAFIWSSSLTKGFRNIPSLIIDFTKEQTGYGLCHTGGTILDLYRTAYNNRLLDTRHLTPLHASRATVVAKDTVKYYARIDGVRTSAATYIYQLIAGRPSNRQQLQKIMQEDLSRYFGLSATWEKRRRSCLVVSMFDSTKAQAPSREYANYIGDAGAYVDGVSVKEMIFFMEQMSFFSDQRPIVDETGFKGLLTGIYFEANCVDVVAFDKGLSKFGMHIKEEVRDVDILVLKEIEITD